MRDKTLKNLVTWLAFILLVVPGARAQAQLSGPTLDEPFHMPTLTDTSTLDVVVVEPWHVDTLSGTTRQKLINIHVDDWWAGRGDPGAGKAYCPPAGYRSGFRHHRFGAGRNR